MPRHPGQLERTLRIIIGAALLSLPFLPASPLRRVGLLGITSLLAGLGGSCLAWRWLEVNSCPAQQRD